ncbi:30S ribosomal protein S6 [Aliarcobacter vitoriensis]|uniref:Small ribosomal subunit protein bS6 n=1 Tax=Aliarcobacter vitoriensis TaxID=2011099 RepID=A0A366MX83_9BACT|nr:30S ribosomal protein S6 [Aliarcobacter vitoriensis]RBQ30220.1 30S ribosomal protein S6 [Aliarcobacter vitoriensis]RBQ32631.1 30S ribosomal protein S6 [Arcobacter sp. FW59]
MSKLKHYETMFILKPTLTEEETVAQLEGIKALFEKNGAEIVATENIGIKELAYEIEKCKRGYYFVAYFKAPAASLAEIERNYRNNEQLIRFIFIKYESKKEVTSWTKMSEEAIKRAAK